MNAKKDFCSNLLVSSIRQKRCLCFRYVGKDRVGVFLLQIEKAVFLHEFLHHSFIIPTIACAALSVKQCFCFRYAGKDRTGVFLLQIKKAKAFHGMAESLVHCFL